LLMPSEISLSLVFERHSKARVKQKHCDYIRLAGKTSTYKKSKEIKKKVARNSFFFFTKFKKFRDAFIFPAIATWYLIGGGEGDEQPFLRI